MITFNELLERAKNEKIVVHTPTEKQATILLKALDKKGYEWFSGEKIKVDTKHGFFEATTCYNFSIDINRELLNKKLMYDPLSYYQERDCVIIEFTDIDFQENE